MHAVGPYADADYESKQYKYLLKKNLRVHGFTQFKFTLFKGQLYIIGW